jgi:hypothetical protein
VDERLAIGIAGEQMQDEQVSSPSRAIRLIGARCRGLPLALAMTALAGCGTVLFQSNFDTTPPGQPPAGVQATGTADPFGRSVLISAGGWLNIRREPDELAAGMTGIFPTVQFHGRYTFVCRIFMPTGTGVASLAIGQPLFFGPRKERRPLEFETAILELEFMPENNVSIEGERFGHFQRDASFYVLIDLDTQASPPTAHIALAGAYVGSIAGGSIDTPVNPNQLQFNSFSLWMHSSETGYFGAANIVVTKIN